MAKARMLHGSISRSIQVNKLCLPARLLFSWMIAHADDEGRIKGDPDYIRATVVPMTKWSSNNIKNYLEQIREIGLIYYWTDNDEWFVEFVKWRDYQSIKSDRFKPSKLPSFNKEIGNKMDTARIQNIDKLFPQANKVQTKEKKSNSDEYNPFADLNIRDEEDINPNTYKPKNIGESSALIAFKQLEPANFKAFRTTYLAAAKKGLPSGLFFRFTSEIKQDVSIKNPGAVFNKKVQEYFSRLK